ncbi:MAG: M56 family metallopeptidase [Pirellulales bacterium]
MLPTLNAWLWCLVQTSLVAGVAIGIAAVLRSRRPQWSSSILAGASLCTLILAMLSIIPATHWSLSQQFNDDLSLSIEEATNSTAKLGPESQIRSNNSLGDNGLLSNSSTTSASDLAGMTPQEDTQSTQASEGKESRGEAADAASTQWLRSTAGWLLGQLQHVDDHLRNFERTEPRAITGFRAIEWLGSVVCIFLVGLWFVGWRWVRHLVRESQPIDDQCLQVRLRELCHQMNCKVPQLRQTNKIAVGATVGFWKPQIILNHDWREWSDTEVQAVLLHELAHLIRGDFAWVVIGSWIRVLFFYHPLVQLLVRRWRMEQEFAADQLAVACMSSAKAYGRALASLALRAQTIAKLHGPVLTAEQVCIVRRVTMLKQGSLKPSQYRWRAVAMLTLFSAASLLPLSGLRGKQPLGDDEPKAGTVADEPVNTELSDADKEIADERRAKLLEMKAVNEAFPPVEIVGRLKWSPGKLLTADVDPRVRYLQDLVAFLMFEQFPEKAEIHCPATIKMSWEDMKREHGRLELGAMADQTHGIDSKLFARMATNYYLGRMKKSSIKKLIEGHEATGLVAKKWNESFTAMEEEIEPSKWIVQEDEQFYFGSEEEVAASIRRAEGRESADSESKSLPLVDIPKSLEEDFQQAAFSLVYSDCNTWEAKFKKHVQGSPKSVEFALVYPFLTGLEQIGVFLTGDQGATLKVRLEYSSQQAAARGEKGIRSLIAMALSGTDPNAKQDQALRALLNSLKIEVNGQQTVVTSENSTGIISLIHDETIVRSLVGWQPVLSYLTTPDDPERWAKSPLLKKTDVGTSAVKLNAATGYLSTTGFLAQTIKAENYRGKRIRISAEIGGEQLLQEHCGTILWAADSAGSTLGNATSGTSVGKIEKDSLDVQKIFERNENPEFVWQKHTVECDVPQDADQLSFGAYLAIGEVFVRDMKFEVIGASSDFESAVAAHSIPSVPRNLLHIPGMALQDQPTNLDFSQIVKTTDQPASTSEAARSASVSEDNSKSIR